MSLDPPAAADRTWRNLVLVLAVTTVARLALAGVLDLGPDESYALAVAGSFQWSFFDHPPLAFWIAGLMEALFGRGVSPILARLPFVLMFSGTTWAMFALTARFFGARAGLWAAGLLNAAPFFFISAGSWIVPDGPLLLALLLAGICLVRVLESGDAAWRDWLGVGVFAGLALLSKYQAGIVILGGFVVLLAPANRRWLGRPQPYVAALIAFVLFAPVLCWNATHDWISFAFQLGRGEGTGHPDPAHGLAVILGEALYLLPWLLIALLAAAVFVRGPAARLLLWLGLPLILIFNALAFIQSGALPHWSMPGWLFLFPLLGRLAADAVAGGRRWPAIMAAVSALTLGVLCVGAVLVFSDWRLYAGNPGLDRAMAESTSWTGVRDGLAARGLLDRPNTFFAAVNWLEGARLAEAVRPATPVAIFGDDPRGFAFIGDVNARLGKDAIVAVDPGSVDATSMFLSQHFRSVETLGTFTTLKGGRPAFGRTVLLAHGFTTPVAIPYGLGVNEASAR